LERTSGGPGSPRVDFEKLINEIVESTEENALVLECPGKRALDW